MRRRSGFEKGRSRQGDLSIADDETPCREPWLTKKEVAAELRVSTKTIERLKIPHETVGGQNRYRMSAVETSMKGAASYGLVPPDPDLIEVLLTLDADQYAQMGHDLARLRVRLNLPESTSTTEVVLKAVHHAAGVSEHPDRPFLTIGSLARRLQLGERTVRNYVESGEIPSYKFGRARRIDPEDVDRYLARRREGRVR